MSRPEIISDGIRRLKKWKDLKIQDFFPDYMNYITKSIYDITFLKKLFSPLPSENPEYNFSK